MTEVEIQNLAQELINIKIKIKKLEEEQNLAKLELYDNVKGGIRCNGGIVWFVEESIEKRFKKNKLKIILKNEGLSDQTIERIFENSKEDTQRDANIYIKLDK